MAKKARFDLSEEIFSSELFKVERGFSDNLLSRGGGNIIRLTVFGLLDQEFISRYWDQRSVEDCR